jgi:hypothetical protein
MHDIQETALANPNHESLGLLRLPDVAHTDVSGSGPSPLFHLDAAAHFLPSKVRIG